MELYSQCALCIMSNLLHVAGRVLPDEPSLIELTRRAMEAMAPGIRRESSAPVLTDIVFSVLREMSGVNDPFLEEKKMFNSLMLRHEETFSEVVGRSADPLHSALVGAGSANIIDFGAFRNVSEDRVLETLAERLKTTKLPEKTYLTFSDLVASSKRLLILCDNAGEIVLDKVLVRELEKIHPDIRVTCAVRGRPILNDATLEDAAYTGLDAECAVVSTGSGLPGVAPEYCSVDFRELYYDSPVILAKGVGNFESAPFNDDRVFFLYVVKCDTLARRTGHPLNTLMFHQGRGSLL